MPFEPAVETVECDILIVGGGMAGCGAAFEAAQWARPQGLRVCMVEKAAIERSGAVAMGLSAINCYMGMRWGENEPEDFVRMVRQDLMGLSREDLVYDLARHVDSSVHLFEEWGLPIFKTPEGKYKREGRWQIMIHGESYKPIVAEAARLAIGEENVFERIFVAHPLLDAQRPHPHRRRGRLLACGTTRSSSSRPRPSSAAAAGPPACTGPGPRARASGASGTPPGTRARRTRCRSGPGPR